MAIIKSNPITTTAFGTWWLRNINITKVNQTTTNLTVSFIPYNGEYALLTSPSRLFLEVNDKKLSDITFSEIYDELITELKRQYALKNNNLTINTFEIKTLNVAAYNPDRPVSIFTQLIVNGVRKSMVITDVFQLAANDMTFAVTLNNVMSELGRQGKLAGKID